MRPTERVEEVARNTVNKLLADAGKAAQRFHNQNVRGIVPSRVEIDEIWCFNYCKRDTLPNAKAAPEGAGNVWLLGADDSWQMTAMLLVGHPGEHPVSRRSPASGFVRWFKSEGRSI